MSSRDIIGQAKGIIRAPNGPKSVKSTDVVYNVVGEACALATEQNDVDGGTQVTADRDLKNVMAPTRW
ncbi:hypothetical protein A9W98_13965 [Mycobacterium gordonae]|uniref:Uncharacterized protein n=1 Tax=Mycobacterium gordonae TaxID=1778 RepID=A0A1A6BJS4_MYCGO|nr:hypothetical protein [Mycobacterium gordonae]OBS02607.1 hypothetical protein A9W98_13965 [Mycobacterium gordonae]